MASRRDELNAYVFARKRTVAAFLQPSPHGTEEGAPRPLRAVLPGLVAGAVLIAGFGAWGMFRPTAPKGWDDEAAHVIVGSESTTRYVVLTTDKKKQLHPVLNFASAKLLLTPEKSSVIKVKEAELDNGRIPRGPTLGIPYAPDRMPGPGEAGKQKHWAVCEQPGAGGRTTQKAVFLFAGRDPKLKNLTGDQRLRGDQALYVQGPDGARYLVDPRGTKYLLGGADWKSADPSEHNLLLRSVFNDGAKPQPVTQDWLDTFHDGAPVVFPETGGDIGADAGVRTLPAKAGRVGTVLEAPTGNGTQNYVVLRGKVQRVSPLVAKLLLNSRKLAPLNQAGVPERVSAAAFTPADDEFYGERHWPSQVPRQANFIGPSNDTRRTVCSIFSGMSAGGTPELATWAGDDYPATIPDGATSAYVTPGSGLLYRQVTGRQTNSGSVFLVTDTGLRYAVQSNNDSGTGKSKIGEKATPSAGPDGASDSARAADGTGPGAGAAGPPESDQARTRLGYGSVNPLPVPANWSQFLPTGPRLDTNSARQPQGS
ncbi:type VII secretion protein EccB [Streptomyces telluris]|uniref:Type VII secretion protein EccB n=1 Tax=Streptomyces telluris TaxID=2720021 RepID=A0A9X2LC75_9ACTN|nr:type VII secretion protein EccB [Streptomyces telluris]MCQ8768587.1 type VII secretion protein EccB [Streptomyces telluris]NJP78814.1 type VII secretion protein EccB [Streptomyces telluris]